MKTDIAAIIEEQKDPRPFSGVVMVRESGKIVFARGYGYANRAEKIANRVDTRFGIASGSKVFTAVAILQLIEAGKLDADTRLKNCLDVEFPSVHPNVTVHQLLTHTSGMPDYFDEAVMDDFAALWREYPPQTIEGPRDLLPLMQDGERQFAPGERFHYNNGGYVVLGLIIEQQTGMRFTDVIEERIFAPCGMTDSGYFRLDALPPRTAHAYVDEEDGSWHTNIYDIPVIGQPDGGAFVTALDMAKFWDALSDHHLLRAETVERMLTPHAVANDEETWFYGYGVWMIKRDDGRLAYHVEGCDPGVAFMSQVNPERKSEITVLGNSDDMTWHVHWALQEALVI